MPFSRDVTPADAIQSVRIHAGSIPSTPILWPPTRHKEAQIQQTKGSAKPQASFVLPTTQPNQSIVPARTTPAHVSSVRIVTRPAVAGNKVVTVQFNHPGNDPYFQGARVYLKRAGKDPYLVAGGAKSPISFTVPVTQAPHAVYVTSTGNWGETDVLTSPSAHVRLI